MELRSSSYMFLNLKRQPCLLSSPPSSFTSLPQPNNTKQPFFFTTSPSRQFFHHHHNNSLKTSFIAASATPATVENSIDDKLPADLHVTQTPEPNSKLRLSVEVPAAVCDDCHKRVVKELMKNSKVPGFRPGKNVPESILIGFVGKQNVQKATIESILKRTLPHAVSSVSGKALKDSIRIATKFPDMEKTYSSLNYLRYDVLVDVAPEVKWIPENGYENLKVVVEIDSDIDAQTASEQEIRRRHKTLGALKIVTDRGLQIGDVVVLDISATTIEQDTSKVQKIPSAESKGFQLDTEDGDKVLPGFVGSIIGIQRGETKSFPFVFPESWKQEDLRGVLAQFTVECKELFYRDLPELNDSIANKLLPDCNTIEEVKSILLERCQELEKTAKEQAADNAILDQLSKVFYSLLQQALQTSEPYDQLRILSLPILKVSDISISLQNRQNPCIYFTQMIEVDVPQSLFEEQGRELYGAQLLQVQANTKLNDQQLAYLSSPKAVKEFLENQKENITKIIKQNLAVGDIFKRENLQFSTEELVKEVENSIAEFKRQNQEYDEERVRDQVQEILEGAKVLEWLREHAEIQYVTR